MSTATASELEVDGTRGRVLVRCWAPPEPRYLALIAHGYAEHSGRYDHVARHLADRGAVVYAPDHLGHGRSDGERASIDDLGDVVADLALVHERARDAHPELPIVLIGHSLGGIVATRFVQTQPARVDVLVLSAPFVGGNPQLFALLGLDALPDVPVDPEILSRDPAVGEAFLSDELVYHGPLRRETLTAMAAAVDEIAAGPDFGDLPVLWIHGSGDALAPPDVARPVVERLAGETVAQKLYPGARHEPFNETNRDEVLSDVAAFVDRALATAVR